MTLLTTSGLRLAQQTEHLTGAQCIRGWIAQ
jgi:hypothetical protein